MQILVIIVFVLSIMMLWMITSKRMIKLWQVITLFVITIIMQSIQINIEGIRWQLYPLYIAMVALGTMVYFRVFTDILVRKKVRRSLTVFTTILLAISGIAAFVFPVYEMPLPSGEYLIGTESFVIEDENRIELYSDDIENRKIKIQLWYPAELTEGYKQAPWLEDGLVVARAVSTDNGLPFFALDHTVDVMSNSYINAPISDALTEYPVIIISHGWRGFRNLHTDFAEELASQGYIVIGIDHTYGSVATVFSDDDIALLNLGALPERDTTPDFLEYANQLVYTYAGDITTTINYLEELNDSSSSSRFSGRFDLTKIGLLGHSTGGGAEVAAAQVDNRIDALIGLDAWVEPLEETEINQGLDIPSLFLRSGTWETGHNNADLYTLIESSSYPSALYQIDGTTHYDFAMVYMYSPLTKYIGITGEVESEYLNSILKSMISDFFNETIKNDSNSEIDIDMWEEVKSIPTQ